MDEIMDILDRNVEVPFPYSDVLHLNVSTSERRTKLNVTSTMQGIGKQSTRCLTQP